MNSIDRLREATRGLAARVDSLRPHHSSLFVAQRKGFGYHSDIKGLPTVALAPIQSVGGSSFGQFFFMVGVDGLGNAPLGGG